MSGFYKICKDCVYYKPTKSGVECGITYRAPNFVVQCPRFKPNGVGYKGYIARCKERLYEHKAATQSVLIVGCMIGSVVLISALLLCYFNISPQYMILAALFSILCFVFTAVIYSSRIDTHMKESCQLYETEVAHVKDNEEKSSGGDAHSQNNPIITIAGIVSYLKEMGYSPNVEVHDGIEWIAFRYGRYNYHISYVAERLSVVLGFSYNPSEGFFEPAFLMAANRMMAEYAHVRVYMDDRSVTFDLFNVMRYMDEVRDNLCRLLTLVEHARDIHAHYYTQILEHKAQEQQSQPQPQSDRVN